MTDEAKALVEECHLDAKAFRENTVYDSDGDPIRLIANANRLDQYADLIETQAREAAAKDAEIARLRKELSDMATKYSCAVDTFNTGFSGYEAVLLHQRRIADEGPPSNWKDGMKAYAARAALAGDSHDQ